MLAGIDRSIWSAGSVFSLPLAKMIALHFGWSTDSRAMAALPTRILPGDGRTIIVLMTCVRVDATEGLLVCGLILV